MKSGVVVFPFGKATQISNQILGSIASRWAEAKDAQVITHQNITIKRGIETTYLGHPEEKNPPSILRISYEVADWAKARHIDKLYVIAISIYMPRCKRDLNYAFIKTRYLRNFPKIIIPEEEADSLKAIWECYNSEQRHINKKKWEKRESLLMSLPMDVYEFFTL